MHIYVPDKKASKPPILVSPHSCGNTASGQFSGLPKLVSEADAQGYIIIYPDNPERNCWDVGSANALKRDGGNDAHAASLMVKYALTKYSADASRVYIAGGSGGGMMTQAMLALYPDMFRAGMSRAGVAAGCWADGYASSNQWSGNCAGGNTTKTAQQWGDLVRNMNPSYSGHRPRVQLVHGDKDETINYKNLGESIKEWTNVLGLPTEPTSNDTYKAIASYNRQFWKSACGYNVLEAWTSPGGMHSMKYEETDILKFFGLVAGSTADPEPDCNGDAGVPSTGGTSGSGGTTGGGGAGGGSGGRNTTSGTGGTQSTGGSDTGGRATGSGGGTGMGGRTGGAGGGGAVSAGGSSETQSSSAQAGSSGGGSSSAAGGGGSSAKSSSSRASASSGGTSGNGGSSVHGSSSGAGGSEKTSEGTTSKGSGCSVGGHGERSLFPTTMLLSLALGFAFRRRRRARR
jgi:acetylxylan esterase